MEEGGSHDSSVFVIDDYYFPCCVKFMNEALWSRGRRKRCAQSLVLSAGTRDFSCVPMDREISCGEK